MGEATAAKRRRTSPGSLPAGKTPKVPLHKSTLEKLRDYIKQRDRFFAERPWRQPANRIFVSTHGAALTSTEIGYDFRMLTRRIGLRVTGASHGPRIHDLRHRFAVATLVRWYRTGKDVAPLLPVLSTYLGHVFITGTYWYLTCTPELSETAAKRLDSRWKGATDAKA